MALLQSQFPNSAILPITTAYVSPALSLSRGIIFTRNNSSLRFGRHARVLRRQNQCRCYAAALGPQTLQWVSAVSSAFGRHARVLRRQNQCRCYAAALGPQTLQWVSAVSSAVLMVAKGTVIQKAFLVPFFALQAPPTVISWINGQYGTWTAFLILLIRLFYLIPGELELPFLTMLLVISAPYEAINLRGSHAGAIISLAVAAYLAFQHFSNLGSLQRAFDQASFIPTLAIICIVSVSCMLLLCL